MQFSKSFEDILLIHLPKQDRTIGDRVSKLLNRFLKNKNRIMQGKLPIGPVRLAISYVCSNSGRWAAVHDKVDKKLKNKDPMNLLKPKELDYFLKSVYGTHHGRGYRNSSKKIPKFLKACKNLGNELKQTPRSQRLQEFLKGFESSLKVAQIGHKGRDNLIRDCGFLERIPIDVHEQRFLLRTGIFHRYATLANSDPTEYDHMAIAMREFCRNELKGLDINGMPLSDAPGLVDLVVWFLSQGKTEKEISLAICAKDPKCHECPLKDPCLFAGLHHI